MTSTGAEKPLWDPCGLCDLPLFLQGGLREQVAACAAWQLCEPEQSHVWKEEGREPHRNWILKASPKFKSSCNLNRNLLFAAN